MKLPIADCQLPMKGNVNAPQTFFKLAIGNRQLAITKNDS